jgi:hypothetical protein
MQLFSWLHQRMTGRPHTRRTSARKPRRRFRPQLDALEDRWMPSTMTVTSLADHGHGTLRAEIAAAHSGDTIDFAPSLDGKTITLTNGELVINKSLTIQGPGASQLTVNGNQRSRIFEVDGTNSVSLSGLTLIDGFGVAGGKAKSGEGGAILNFATLTVNDCTISNNLATQYGGGIFNVGTLMVNGCSISNNVASTFSSSPFHALFGGAIENTGTATLSNCTLSGNSVGYSNTSFPQFNTQGGAIFNAGTMTISGCTLSGNAAYDMGLGGSGGAITNDGSSATMTISGSTISGNTAGNFPYNNPYRVSSGGGITNKLGTLTVTDCTLSANQAVLSVSGFEGNIYDGRGGAVWNSGRATLTNCTLSGNYAGGAGGAIWVGSPRLAAASATLTNCTVGANSVSTAGGGMYVDNNGILNLTNTIVAGNTATYWPDIYGAVATADHNLVGDATGSTGIVNGVNGNIAGGNGNPVINADLGPLQNNGGPTQTMALLAGSPAIGNADNAAAPATDQRGVIRFDLVAEMTDIGAFEL